MNRIKCANCGFVSWATAETCKRCGASLSESHEVAGPSESINDQSPGRPKRGRILFTLIALIALSVGVFAFKKPDPDAPHEFILKDESKKSSKTWYQSWFSSDPSADEIVAQYSK